MPAAEIQPFDPAHPVYQPMPESPSIDAQSATILAALDGTVNHFNCFIDTDGDSPPVYIGSESDPLWTLTVADAEFSGLEFEIRAPADIAPGAGVDAPLVILDRASAQYGGYPIEYRMFDTVVTFASLTITAAVAGIGSYRNDGIGYLGDRALGMAEIIGRNTGSGNSYTVGMIRPHEIEQGYIPHAIRVALGHTATTYRWPADRSDGVGSYPSQAEMGSRIFLPSSTNLTTINTAIDAYVDGSNMNAPARAAAKTMAKAMKEFGLAVLDSRGTSGAFNFYMEGADTADWVTLMGPRNSFGSWNHIGRCLRDCIPWEDAQIAAASVFNGFGTGGPSSRVSVTGKLTLGIG